jgi:DNA polymerase-1
MDTMLAHHVCFAGLPKGLDFLSSIYCTYHRYWKDDGKLWDLKTPEDQLWEYNCKDCVTTWEVSEELENHIDSLGLREQFKFQMRQFPAVLRMMLRGVRCDTSLKSQLVFELEEARAERETWVNTAVGRELNIKSPKQMKEFFYDELNIKPIYNRKAKGPGSVTTNDDALEQIKTKRMPVLRPLVERIQDLRSIGVFLSTFANMKLDRDQRIRCSYNIAGTETFRYSSSENAFGSGTNLQNIPAGDEAHLLPNIRKFFVPDVGYEMADADLDRADAQVVAWEANDDELKQIFREGADLHLENAKVIFNNPRLTSDSRERKLAKAGVHATNYGSSANTLARALGITVHEAERFQRVWFSAHPGIRDWHDEVENSLATTRQVTNKFGFRRYYFDRIEKLLPEALAWIPQSTVALVICYGLVRMTEQTEVDLQPLLQVHDSLVFQYPKHLRNPALRKARECMLVEVPYDDPLVIPVGFKLSDRSWGDCKEYDLEKKSFAA